jgi:flagellar protein FliO/FliZ
VNPLFAAVLSGLAAPAIAGDGNGTPTGTGALQAILGLVAVLVLMAALSWLVKRIGLAQGMGNSPVKVIGGVSVGGRERVIVVEAGDQWIVLGVAPGRVNALTTMPRRDDSTTTQSDEANSLFLSRLKQGIQKQRGN